MRIAVTMLVLGGSIRFFATLPGLEDRMEGQAKFLLVLAGGAIVEVGHPFSMIVATKVTAMVRLPWHQVSQTWFLESERMVTTGMMALAPSLATIITSQVTQPTSLSPRWPRG